MEDDPSALSLAPPLPEPQKFTLIVRNLLGEECSLAISTEDRVADLDALSLVIATKDLHSVFGQDQDFARLKSATAFFASNFSKIKVKSIFFPISLVLRKHQH